MATLLTKKEAGFVKDYARTRNGTHSALKNYNTKSKNTAAALASENLTKPKIIKAIKSLADQIPDALVVKRHKELLNKREYLTIKGETGDVGPDTQAVTKAVDMAYKLKGSYAAEKQLHLMVMPTPDEQKKIDLLFNEI